MVLYSPSPERNLKLLNLLHILGVRVVGKERGSGLPCLVVLERAFLCRQWRHNPTTTLGGPEKVARVIVLRVIAKSRAIISLTRSDQLIDWRPDGFSQVFYTCVRLLAQQMPSIEYYIIEVPAEDFNLRPSPLAWVLSYQPAPGNLLASVRFQASG